MAQDGKSAGRSRRARGSLSAEEILDAAYALVEEGGLGALSMPALARRLRAGVTSIYWYFRSKDELLVALAEQVAEEIYAALPQRFEEDQPWEDALEELFCAWRRELRRAPVFLELFRVQPTSLFTRPAVFRIMTRHLDRFLSVLTRAGFSPTQAMQLYLVCSTYTRGYVVFEEGMEQESSEVGPDARRQLSEAVGRLDAEEFPLLSQVPEVLAAGYGDDQFLLGLRLLIRGIAASTEDAVAIQEPELPARRVTRAT